MKKQEIINKLLKGMLDQLQWPEEFEDWLKELGLEDLGKEFLEKDEARKKALFDNYKSQFRFMVCDWNQGILKEVINDYFEDFYLELK